jgi:hypothetical protein
MKRHKPLILLTLLALLVSGCEVFPYVMENTPVAPEGSLEPTLTHEPSKEPTASPPTATLAPPRTPTATPEEVSEEELDPTPTLTPAYTLQEGSPVTLPNFNHPEAGCNWLGVAGQVFNKAGEEVLGLTVLVGDDQSPGEEPNQAFTGDALAYGLGGFEIQISEAAFDSSARFWIQVFDAQSAPLTARHHFSTYADCEKNLILVNFVPQAEEAQDKRAPTLTLEAYP